MKEIKSKLDARALAAKAISNAPHINGVNIDLSIAKSISDTLIGNAELPENGSNFKSRIEVRQFVVENMIELCKSANVSITSDKITAIENFIVGNANLPEYVAS